MFPERKKQSFSTYLFSNCGIGEDMRLRGVNSFEQWLNYNQDIFKSNNKIRLDKIPG